MHHSQAQNNLGLLYKFGDGVEKDKNRAFYWFNVASSQSNKDAIYNLGLLYRQNKKEDGNVNGIKYITKAANLGHPPAQNHLA